MQANSSSLEMLLGQMEENIGVVSVQTDCLKKLNAVVEKHDHLLKEEVWVGNFVMKMRNGARRMYDEGGISVIGHAMRRHPNDPTIHAQALMLMSALACFAPNRAVIAKNGGAKLIVNTMKAFSDNPRILTLSCVLFINFVVETESMAQRILFGRLGGAELLVNAIRAFPSKVDLLDHAIGILEDLSNQVPNYLDVIAANDGVNVIILAMEAHPLHLSIQRNGIKLLLLLSDQDASSTAVIDQISRVWSVTNSFKERLGQQDENCKSLLFFATINSYFPQFIANAIKQVAELVF
eukprot:m.10444 g.10444  ORF g.10444 m.10444 type:complete len:294 (-) comp6602_c1_seq1:66-947(-)